MLQGRVGGGKDGEYKHKDRARWKSLDQYTGCFPFVETLFAGVVCLKYILILLRLSYPSSSKRRLETELARLFCVAFSNWEAWKRAEHVAVDQAGLLRITWNMCVHRSIQSVLSNTESRGSKSRSPGSSAWACFNPRCNTTSVLKVSAAVRGTASRWGCHCAPDLLVNRASPVPFVFGLPSFLVLQAQS